MFKLVRFIDHILFNPTQQLFSAINEQDIPKIMSLIARGADVSSKNNNFEHHYL